MRKLLITLLVILTAAFVFGQQVVVRQTGTEYILNRAGNTYTVMQDNTPLQIKGVNGQTQNMFEVLDYLDNVLWYIDADGNIPPGSGFDEAGNYTTTGDWGNTGTWLFDSVELNPQASDPITPTSNGIWVNSGDDSLYYTDSTGTATQLGAGFDETADYSLTGDWVWATTNGSSGLDIAKLPVAKWDSIRHEGDNLSYYVNGFDPVTEIAFRFVPSKRIRLNSTVLIGLKMSVEELDPLDMERTLTPKIYTDNSGSPGTPVPITQYFWDVTYSDVHENGARWSYGYNITTFFAVQISGTLTENVPYWFSVEKTLGSTNYPRIYKNITADLYTATYDGSWTTQVGEGQLYVGSGLGDPPGNPSIKAQTGAGNAIETFSFGGTALQATSTDGNGIYASSSSLDGTAVYANAPKLCDNCGSPDYYPALALEANGYSFNYASFFATKNKTDPDYIWGLSDAEATIGSVVDHADQTAPAYLLTYKGDPDWSQFAYQEVFSNSSPGGNAIAYAGGDAYNDTSSIYSYYALSASAPSVSNGSSTLQLTSNNHATIAMQGGWSSGIDVHSDTTGTSSTHYLFQLKSGSPTTELFSVWNDGRMAFQTDILAIDTDGDVGINTTSPVANLEIRSTSSSGVPILGLYNDSPTSNSLIVGYNNDPALVFQVSPDGQVGIGANYHSNYGLRVLTSVSGANNGIVAYSGSTGNGIEGYSTGTGYGVYGSAGGSAGSGVVGSGGASGAGEGVKSISLYNRSMNAIQEGTYTSNVYGNTLRVWRNLTNGGGGSISEAMVVFDQDTNDGLDLFQIDDYTGYITGFDSQGSVFAESYRFNSNYSKPTCDATTRTEMWYTKSGASTADTIEICMKNSSDTYQWVTIVTAP